MRWFSFGAEATGVIAVGQFATGVVAIGQVATGAIAVGQLARGGIVVGQLAFGLVTVGQLGVGLVWAGGMVGFGGWSGFGAVLPLIKARPSSQPLVIGAPARLPRLELWRLAILAVLAVAYWFAVAEPIYHLWFDPGGVLRPLR